ncbi:MAG: putative porin [Bacteroidota bacterium]|nr:putative porin [Bacteroidota bacterium]
MKEKLFVLLLVCLLHVATAWPQARVILPDSSKITTNPDSLKLLPRQVPERLGVDSLPDSLGGQLSRPGHLQDDHGTEGDSLQEAPRMFHWKLNPRTGDRIPTESDTVVHNFQHSTLADGYSVAMGHLGTLGSPVISKIFSDRGETETFIFNNAYFPFLRKPDELLFLNTRVPYSRLNYYRSGNNQTREDRFNARLTSNFGKSLNVGLDVDLINARGHYNSQSTRHNNFSLFGNYLSERIEAHMYMNLGKISHFENGGITDDLFITDPDAIRQQFNPRDIPVKFTNTWNTLGNNRFFLSGRYNLGYYEVEGSDSLMVQRGDFVPVASLSFSSSYTDQFRRFLSHDTILVNVEGVPMQRIDKFYPHRFYEGAVDDSVHFSSFKNCVALSLREGFKKWVKFGLTAFLEYDLRNYSMRDTVGMGYVKHRESAVTLGGVLNKQQGENLLFNIRADLGVLGVNLGEFRAMGDVQTGFDIAGRRTTLSAEAYIKNLRPKYLQENYFSKYFKWNKELGDTRRVYLGGKLHIPFTNSTVSAGVENLQNFIYYNRDRMLSQEGDNVQLLTARVDQDIRLGVFNWDNRVVYQASSNQEVIPVPTLSVYSNLYLKALIVKVLTMQVGIDAHWHTKYHVPGYEPALLQFYNQDEKEIGNYPISTIYANFHLQQTRFFVMFYNVASQLLKPTEYFSLPNYPVNPFLFKMGVSVNLNN